MQIKTIKKVIKEKLESWLLTIQDEELRKDVRKELLVSGGSIASLLLGEPVNDYDIYIKTVETAERLAKYYANAFQSDVKVYSGKNKDKYLSDELYNNDEIIEEAKYGMGITKVFFQNLKEEQVKLWLGKDSGFRTDFEDTEEGKYLPIYFSPNAISLSDKIQIVLRFTGDHKQIHKSFDFVHATNYFTFEDGLVTNTKALESLLTKQLQYQGSLYPLTSIIRTKKFIKRNWNINAGEYLKIMFQISELDLKNVNTLEEQLAGVDVAYFGMLINILRDQQTNHPEWELSYEWLLEIIDKVFSENE